MKRGTRCSVCASTDRVQIDALLTAGLRQNEVARQFPTVSKYAVSRHSRTCVAPPVLQNLHSDAGAAEIALWMERADATYQSATCAGDTRSAVASLSAAFRGLQFKLKQAEKQKEQDSLSSGNHVMTVEESDSLLEKYIDSCPPNTCPLCAGRTGNDGRSLDPSPDGKNIKEMVTQ